MLNCRFSSSTRAAPVGALFVLLVVSSACGCDRARPAQHVAIGPPAAPTPPAPVQAPTPPTSSHAEAPPCAALGYAAAPRSPTKAAQALNLRALAEHRAGRYESSARGFESALALEPTYAAARFNLACAHARLERLEEARRAIHALLCEDLPSYAPRLTSDPDLEPLRAELSALVPAIARQYAAAAASGAALVAGGTDLIEHRPDSAWTQPGIWSHGARRFVPMGPRVREGTASSSGWPIAAAHFDAHRMRSLIVTMQGNDAEGGVALARVHIQTFVAPTGEVELDVRPPLGETYLLEVALAETGANVYLPGWQRGPRPVVRSVSATMPRVQATELEGTRLRLGPVSWSPATPASGYEIVGDALRTPSGEVRLGAGHRALDRHTVRVTRDASVAFAISSRWGDCGLRDRYVIDRVERAGGAVTRMAAGEGQPHLEVGSDGAVYLQVGAELRRWPSASSEPSESEVLPTGIWLSSQPDDFNPYC